MGTRKSVHHHRKIHVSWGDCDAAGVVYYPRYYEWFDTSTHAMLAQIGLDHRRLRQEYNTLGTPLVRAEADFRGSATYGDELLAECHIAKVGIRSFTVEHQLSRAGKIIVQGREVRVWAEPAPPEEGSMRSAPLPDSILAILEPHK